MGCVFVSLQQALDCTQAATDGSLPCDLRQKFGYPGRVDRFA